jgi:hypothetical protein
VHAVSISATVELAAVYDTRLAPLIDSIICLCGCLNCVLHCSTRQVEIIMIGAFFIAAASVTTAINKNYRGVGDDSLAAVRTGDCV